MNNIEYISLLDDLKDNNINDKSKILLEREDHIFLHNTSRIELAGKLVLGYDRVQTYGRPSILRMEEESALVVKGNFVFYYGADIRIFKGGTLTLGENSYINSDCKIRCSNRITIDNDCAISHDLTILDSDFHEHGGKCKNRDVYIGKHVWIGTRVIILKNVHIGEGSIIAAGSVVTHDVKPHCMVAGVPARIIKTNVEWR